MKVKDRRSGSGSKDTAPVDENGLLLFGGDNPALEKNRNPHPTVQLSRKWRKPNKAEVEAELSDDALVQAVLETFRFEASMTKQLAPQYTKAELMRRAQMFVPFYLMHRLECGMSKSEALQVASQRVLSKLFGLPEPVIPFYRGGVRVEGAGGKKAMRRSLRAVAEVGREVSKPTERTR